MSRQVITINPGDRFGRLVALRPSESHKYKWECECDCGNTATVDRRNLARGATQSCGCLHRERTGNASRRHGGRGTPEYRIWKHMLGRCHTATDTCYPDYGGRGIVVCEGWRARATGFPAFLAHVGKRPSDKHSIGRINNDGNYEPGNVRWETRSEQDNNTRSTVWVTINGVRRSLKQWCDELNVPYGRTATRIRRGWDGERALMHTKMRIVKGGRRGEHA
jgi:hypothetical protein